MKMPEEKKDNSVDIMKAATQSEEKETVVDIKPVAEGIKFLRENSEKRNFNQTFDLIINLKNMDAKKEMIKTEVILPHGKGKEIKVGFISDDAEGDNVITTKEMEAIAKKPSEAKKLVKEFDYFIASAPLMVTVGKLLGRYLAPAGKMPKPIPPKADPAPFIAAVSKSITLKNNKQMKLQCSVGTQENEDEQIIENVKTVVSTVEKSLPKGIQNIKNVLIKLTMSRPVSISMK